MSLSSKGLGLAVLRLANTGLSFCLSMALAAVFGVNRQMDALFIALAVAVFLARDLAGVIRTALVPCLIDVQERPPTADFLASYHAALLWLAFGAGVLVWAAAPAIVLLMAPGFDPDTAEQALRFLRLLAPSVTLFLLLGSAQGCFHARRKFLIPELSETLWRVAAVGALFTLGRTWGASAYATGLALATFVQWGFMAAMARQAGVQILPLRWQVPTWQVLRPIALGAVVVLCSVTQLQVEAFLDRAVLSFMAPGAITIFYYAERLAHMLPVLFSTSLLIPWLPEIARIQARVGDPRRLAKQGALFLAALGAMLGLVFGWAAPDLVDFLLLRGKFDAASAALAIRAVQAFALGIPAIYCVQCLAGLYIVGRDVKAMARLGLVAVVVHLAGNLALYRFGVPGIALSGSLTVWIVAAYLWQRIPSREPVWFPWLRFAASLAAVLACLYAIPWDRLVPWPWIQLATGASTAAGAYLVVMWPAIRRMQAYEQTATVAALAPTAASPPAP